VVIVISRQHAKMHAAMFRQLRVHMVADPIEETAPRLDASFAISLEKTEAAPKRPHWAAARRGKPWR
jgi:hypothetical protein